MDGRMKHPGAGLLGQVVSHHRRIKRLPVQGTGHESHTRPRGTTTMPLRCEVRQVLASDRAWLVSRGPPHVVPDQQQQIALEILEM